MIGLFKIAVEGLLTIAVFCGGVLFAVKNPTWATKIVNFITFVKTNA